MECVDASTVGHVNWSGYVESVTKDGPTAIASRIGVSAPSVSRWWGTTNRPRPEQAAEFARQYNRPVLEAFIAAGFLTPEEASQQPSAPPSLAPLSDDELLAEVRARMKGESGVADPAQKIGGAPAGDDRAKLKRELDEARQNAGEASPGYPPSGGLSLVPPAESRPKPDTGLTDTQAAKTGRRQGAAFDAEMDAAGEENQDPE